MGKHGIVVEADDVDSVGVGGGGNRIGIRIIYDVGGKSVNVGGAIHSPCSVGEIGEIVSDRGYDIREPISIKVCV